MSQHSSAFPVDFVLCERTDGMDHQAGLSFRQPVLPGRSHWGVEWAIPDVGATFDPLNGPSPMPERWTMLRVPHPDVEDAEDWAAMGVLAPGIDDIASGTHAYGGLKYFFKLSAWDYDIYEWSEFQELMARLVFRFTAVRWTVEPEQLRNTEPLDFAPLLESPVAVVREAALFAVTFDRASLA